jgi:hypothetical protein
MNTRKLWNPVPQKFLNSWKWIANYKIKDLKLQENLANVMLVSILITAGANRKTPSQNTAAKAKIRKNRITKK